MINQANKSFSKSQFSKILQLGGFLFGPPYIIGPPSISNLSSAPSKGIVFITEFNSKRIKEYGC